MAAAEAGAASVGVFGWMAEECRSAALERIVRSKPEDSGAAFTMGRYAAIDELRRLAGRSRSAPQQVPWPKTWLRGGEIVPWEPTTEDDLPLAYDLDDLGLPWHRLTVREEQAVRLAAELPSGVAVAAAMGICPGRVTTLIQAARRKFEDQRERLRAS